MRWMFIAGIVMLTATCNGTAIWALTLTFDSQPGWQAVTSNGITVFHFDGPTELNGLYANDSAISPSYSSQGVDFLPFTGTEVMPMIARNQHWQILHSDGDGLLANNISPNSDVDGRAIKFNFNREMRAVGVFTNGSGGGDGGYIAAYDALGALIAKADISAGGFGGIVSDQVIHHVEIVNTFDGDLTFGVYDLQFSPVPEPSAFVLLSIAATSLFAYVCRRQ
jgi:hypothetical protein